ncbi:hypothetical protein GCM10011394_00450 [Luteimonas terricola]|uniref:Uncharacterized protein n=1 Tax=Luteimonas terricola TaxID=645597 RepID=A0ABQ2E4R1_9GAMM|nr:hypothetical protein GCM10011394_00450 [Luteimonas terricola]
MGRLLGAGAKPNGKPLRPSRQRRVALLAHARHQARARHRHQPLGRRDPFQQALALRGRADAGSVETRFGRGVTTLRATALSLFR